jgi:hypothetical protein
LLRKPRINKRNPAANVIAQLPAGQMMVRMSGKKGAKFLEVQTSVNGAHFRGFVAAEHLQPVKVLKGNSSCDTGAGSSDSGDYGCLHAAQAWNNYAPR